MALPYPTPDPATGLWDAFALKQNLEYLDQQSAPIQTAALGVIHNDLWTGGGSDANTSEKIIDSFVLKSNALATRQDTLYLLSTFTTEANANTKRFRLYFGATVAADTGAVAMNDQRGVLEAWIARATGTTQLVVGRASWSTRNTASAVTALMNTALGTETMTSPVTITVTVQNGTASAGDCIVFGLAGILYPFRD